MTSYDLYLESGPRRRKTMVHVLDLLGCIAVGPTTEEALAATPEAVTTYRRFLAGSGEAIDPDEPFETRIAEHITEGVFIGNGSPYILFAPDLAPLTGEEIPVFLHRAEAIADAIGAWTASQSAAALAAEPATGGRPAGEIVRHVLAARGSYLSSALGGAPGFGAVVRGFTQGEIDARAAFAASSERINALVTASTPEQRSGMRRLPSGHTHTLRQGMRRLLEHDWEHLAELSRRPGGPAL